MQEVDNSAVHAGHRIQTKRYSNADAEKTTGFQVALKFLKIPIFLGLPKIPKKEKAQKGPNS